MWIAVAAGEGEPAICAHWLGLGRAKGWKVDAYIVVDHPLMAPFLRETPMRIVPFGEFESELLKKYGKGTRNTSVTN